VKGAKGQLSFIPHDAVKVVIQEKEVVVGFDRENSVSKMHAGTARANIANMITGISQGFEKKLTLIGWFFTSH
jgi:large subunit ribosomal protein L6